MINSHARHLASVRAFTLLELLVVVSIILVLLFRSGSRWEAAVAAVENFLKPVHGQV